MDIFWFKGFIYSLKKDKVEKKKKWKGDDFELNIKDDYKNGGILKDEKKK